jgi:hypothetical protein
LLAKIQTRSSERGGTSLLGTTFPITQEVCICLDIENMDLFHQHLCRATVLPLDFLCIHPGKAVWCLYIDALCINYDGNAFDAALLAMVAALKNSTHLRLCLSFTLNMHMHSTITSCSISRRYWKDDLLEGAHSTILEVHATCNDFWSVRFVRQRSSVVNTRTYTSSVIGNTYSLTLHRSKNLSWTRLLRWYWTKAQRISSRLRNTVLVSHPH